MPARMREYNRVVGRDGAQRIVKRKPLDTRFRRGNPFVLMPAATSHQLARPGSLGRIGDQRHDLVPADGTREVELQLRVAQPEQVPMPLDESGDRQRAIEVDDLGLVTDVALQLGESPHRDDAIAHHRNRLRLGLHRIDGDDGAVP